jgi:large repetitive protein
MSTPRLVADIDPGITSSNPRHLMAVRNSALYFVADDSRNGIGLWKSNGTSHGTTRISDLRPRRPHSENPYNFRVVGNTLFFTANDSRSSTELWKSDGTSGGTTRISDIYAGASGSYPSNLTVVGDNTVF